MDKDRWSKITELYHHAAGLNVEDRSRYLDEFCEDPEMRTELDHLLGVSDTAEEWFDDMIREVNQRTGMIVENMDFDQGLPDKYRIIEPIGRGGMGSVFLAERSDEAYRQQVAIKVLQQGINSPNAPARFLAERQILARLNHPGITSILDGGMTSDGRPWLAMEYVMGMTLSDYCSTHQPEIDEIIRLFLEICDAVQYAHQNLVIHRDLKPTNILVNSEGHIKLLDFGIAKLLRDAEVGEESAIETREGQRLLSLNYAAPEQLTGDPVTTATDVYSLGVLFYEILTGSRPYDLAGKTVREAEQIIRFQEPPRPSTRLNAGNGKLPADLDAIILQALQKEPGQRYPGAGQLADDLRRYLEGYPVRAQRDTLPYRFRKFIVRNKAVVASITALLIVTTAATIVSLNFAIQAQDAERRALTEAGEARKQSEIAETVNLFMQQMIGQADPYTNPTGRDLTLMEAVELAHQRVDDFFMERPEAEPAVRYALGVVDMNLGRLEPAVEQLNRSLNLSLQHFGENNRQTLRVRSQLGLVLLHLGRNDQAREVLINGIDAAFNAPKSDYDSSCMVLNQLGLYYLNTGQPDSATIYFNASLEQMRQIYHEDHPQILTTLHNLSSVKTSLQDFDSAYALAQDVLERRRKVRGDMHPEVAQSLNMISFILMRSGRFEDALPYRYLDVEIREQVYQGDHPDKARGIHNLAFILNGLERYEEALEHGKEALRMWRNTLPETHADRIRSKAFVGGVYHSLGRYAQASELRELHLASYRPTVSPDDRNLPLWIMEASEMNMLAGNHQRARELVSEARQIYAHQFGTDHWRYQSAVSLLGEILMLDGDTGGAEPLLVQSAQAIEEMDNVPGELKRKMFRRVRQLYTSTGRASEAARWEVTPE